MSQPQHSEIEIAIPFSTLLGLSTNCQLRRCCSCYMPLRPL